MIGSFKQQKRRRTILNLERLESRDCPAAYSIVDLLPAGGFGNSDAYGLNDSGLAVGSSSQVSGYRQATVWQAGTGSTRAGTYLPSLTGDDLSEAHDVNNGGMIAGTSRLANGAAHAVVWTGAGGSFSVRDLGSLGGSFTHDSASGLSDPDASGVTWVIGESYNESGDDVRRATVWRVDAAGNTLSIINLETLDPTQSWASDVRVVGSSVYVVGGYATDNGNSIARVWTLDLDGKVMSRTDLGTLGGPSSAGYAINSLGHVAGESKPSANGSYYGFIHRNGVMTNLGSLGNGGSYARALNDSDTVVGFYFNQGKGDPSGGSPYAFVWQNGTMRDLRGQLGKADKALWVRLHYAFDINATGQIVGTGTKKAGQQYAQHGILMTPPALYASTIGDGSDAASIPSEQVQPLLAEARARWQTAGFDVSALSNIDIRIADLGGTTLGLASGNTIWLDDNAAGWGWFVDPTPGDDGEFTTPGDQGEQKRMDLLTVLVHEIGHVLGFEHDEDGVMAESLAAGNRLTLAGTDTLELAALSGLRKKGDLFDWWW